VSNHNLLTMNNHLIIPEELFLLSIDHTGGNVTKMQTKAFQFALSSSILMELALLGKIDTDTDGLIIVDTEPIGSEVLDMALNEMQLHAGVQNMNYWLNKLNERYETFVYALLNGLIRKNMLKIEHQKVLWVFSKLMYPIVGKEEVKDVKVRVRELIFSDELPELHDMAVVSLLYYSGLSYFIFSQSEMDSKRNRVEMIAKMDLLGQHVGERLKQELDLAMAMAGSVMIQ